MTSDIEWRIETTISIHPSRFKRIIPLRRQNHIPQG